MLNRGLKMSRAREGLEGDAYDGSNAGDLYLGSVAGANPRITITGYMKDA